MRNQKQQKDFIKRVESYLKDSENSLKRNRLVMQPIINFVRKRKPPILSRLALKIVVWQGGIIDSEFADLMNKKQTKYKK